MDDALLRSFEESQRLFQGVKTTPSLSDLTSQSVEGSIKSMLAQVRLLGDYRAVKDTEPLSFGGRRTQTKGSSSVSIEQDDTTAHDAGHGVTEFRSSSSSSSSSLTSLVPFSRGHSPVSDLVLRKPVTAQKPEWHAPWKMYRAVAGHVGSVRCLAVDPSNEWFATGGNDKTIMVWDLASCQRKVTLTGHIHNIRGLCISPRHPYLFSVGEDKMVKCWDLESNRVVRQYHGHLSGIYCVSLHPTLDVLLTGGRDCTIRVWDARTKAEIHILSGHKSTVAQIASQATDPQVISSSHDSTIRLWDLAAGKCDTVLTNHKKAVRGLALHPTERTFASGSPDNIKKWLLPEGKFLHNFSGHKAIVNTLCINHDNVLVSGADNGSLRFWDWKTGHCFQEGQTVLQPGSLESEACIYQATFDQSGSRLITCEADKTIKMWKEDTTATPESHPVQFNPTVFERKKF